MPSADICAAYQLFREKAEFAVVSVCEAEHSPLWCGHLPDNQEYGLRQMLDSARAGFPVTLPEGLDIPDSVKMQLVPLLATNMDLSVAWNRFNSDAAMLNSEELIQFFQMERLNEIALNAKIPLVFYFLTLVLLLSTFFFMFRSKQ